MSDRDDNALADAARTLLDKYLVPEGPTRDLYTTLAALQDGHLDALDLLVVQRTFIEMHKAITEIYRPRSPLEAQLEYDRARKDVREQYGVEWGDWVAAEDPDVLDRWQRWNADG